MGVIGDHDTLLRGESQCCPTYENPLLFGQIPGIRFSLISHLQLHLFSPDQVFSDTAPWDLLISGIKKALRATTGFRYFDIAQAAQLMRITLERFHERGYTPSAMVRKYCNNLFRLPIVTRKGVFDHNKQSK